MTSESTKGKEARVVRNQSIDVKVKNRAPSRSCLRWTAQELTQVRDLFEAGLAPSDIADKINRSEFAVRSVLSKKLHIERALFPTNDAAPVNEGAKWTEGELALFKNEWEKGTPVETIAKKLRRSPEAVITKRRKLKLPVRYIRTLDLNEIRSQYDSGVSVEEIARGQGTSACTIRKVLNIGKERSSQKTTEERRLWEIDVIEDRLAHGCTTHCIANRIGRSRKYLFAVISEHDLRDAENQHNDLIVELFNHGLTVEQISMKLDLPRRFVKAFLKSLEDDGNG
ncbi:MAG: hypothetical protein HQL35_14010 [Alphaproteobacteria bacterium]|nr:hypothetical protein [Alphaproteobacteria bacterium]